MQKGLWNSGSFGVRILGSPRVEMIGLLELVEACRVGGTRCVAEWGLAIGAVKYPVPGALAIVGSLSCHPCWPGQTTLSSRCGRVRPVMKAAGRRAGVLRVIVGEHAASWRGVDIWRAAAHHAAR